MSNVIQQRFENAAKYDSMMAKVFPGYEQLPLLILSHLRMHLLPKARLLDVGCGTGAALAIFANHQSEWSFVGVDPAVPMLELARHRIVSLGQEGRVEFIHGNIEAVSNNMFDAATTILVEHLLPDTGAKLEFLEGIHRRIAPGGWFILIGLNGDLATVKAQNALNAWLEFVTLQGMPTEVRDNVRKRATIEDSLIPEKRILELIEQVGFVNCERIHQTMLLGGWIAQRPFR